MLQLRRLPTISQSCNSCHDRQRDTLADLGSQRPAYSTIRWCFHRPTCMNDGLLMRAPEAWLLASIREMYGDEPPCDDWRMAGEVWTWEPRICRSSKGHARML